MPAYFSDAQRQATREAGEIAGLEPVRILNEPTAAALTYEAGQREGKRVVVYDLGGGTFDVSVVRIEDGVVEVISGHGNNHLGGDDFDAKLVGHILDHLKIKQGIDVSGDLRAMARITARRRRREEAAVGRGLLPGRGGVPDRSGRQAGPPVAGDRPAPSTRP